MNQYKVVEAFELDGVSHEVDAVIELSDEQAAELGAKVAKVEETKTGDENANSDAGSDQA